MLNVQLHYVIHIWVKFLFLSFLFNLYSISLIWVLVKRDTTSCDWETSFCSIIIGMPVISIYRTANIMNCPHDRHDSVVWLIDILWNARMGIIVLFPDGL